MNNQMTQPVESSMATQSYQRRAARRIVYCLVLADPPQAYASLTWLHTVMTSRYAYLRRAHRRTLRPSDPFPAFVVPLPQIYRTTALSDAAGPLAVLLRELLARGRAVGITFTHTRHPSNGCPAAHAGDVADQ